MMPVNLLPTSSLVAQHSPIGSTAILAAMYVPTFMPTVTLYFYILINVRTSITDVILLSI